MNSTFWWILAVVMILAASVTFLYLRDMNRAYERIIGKCSVTSSPYGDIEYKEGGSSSGIPILVIHGGGGGYDQGELIAETVLDEQFRWIVPSRFGYLGSTLPDGATWDDQANAYAYLIDHLEIDKVAVVAMSQGGASALLFAVLHPERVSSLVCISCGVAASESELQSGADRKGNALKAIFTYDFPYWAISKLFKKQFLGVMGANKEVIAGLTPSQMEKVDRLIKFMNPASPRSAGAAFDNEATLPGGRIGVITASVLMIHAKDDLLQLYHNAEFAATTIPGSKLMSYESGGHILMLVEQRAVKAAIRTHILNQNGMIYSTN